MTAQHFTELFETVRITTGLSRAAIARALNVSMTTINFNWKKVGVPEQRVGRVVKVFRNILQEAA